MNMNNAFQECAHFPDDGHDATATDLEKGMAQLYFQVQGGEHKIIYPGPLAESSLRTAPWW